MQENQFKIGFVGVPTIKIINECKLKYKNIVWIDLDEPINNPYLIKNQIPKTTCKIIQTILNNILNIKLDLLLATIGKSKCDFMEYLLTIIKNYYPNLEIITVDNIDDLVYPQPICKSNLSLIDKFKLITSKITKEQNTILYNSIPTAGFWGVPPFDYSILKLFPDTTHIYGWTRCMEAKTPSNTDLETFLDINVPTVFYSQLFCAKSILAKYLANKYNGLFVESDGYIDNSIKEKVTAFLELNSCY